jgi:ribose 5-phosphate isomerase B
MLIYIGADHRGFALKQVLKSYLGSVGYEVIDMGNNKLDENDDYPEFALRVAKEVSRDPSLGEGIVICGSGVGMDVVANKFRNVRCSLCFSPNQAMAARNDDNANILSIPADFIDEDVAKKIVSVWLQTKFDGADNHARRIKQIGEIELKTTSYLE